MRTQRVTHSDGSTTLTVIGEDFLPIAAVDEYLHFMTIDGASPHTVRSYAHGLAEWFHFLHLTNTQWDDFQPLQYGQFLTWLRTGDQPELARIGDPVSLLSPATVQLRSAAVRSFYRYHAAAHGLVGPFEAIYTRLTPSRSKPYEGMLHGIADRSKKPQQRPLFRVRSGPRGRTPVLEPDHVHAILGACTTQRENGTWVGSLSALRNRFLFALLAETGMRLGEALGLRHSDIHMGRGDQPSIEVVPRSDHPHLARAKSGRSRRIYVGEDLEGLYSGYVWGLVDAGADLAVEDLPSHHVIVNGATGTGTPFAPLRPETVYAAIRSINRKAQLPQGWTPHWLRHTHATALLLSGCPPHVVMRRLGHADIQTTLSVYGWVTEDAELRAVAGWKQFATGWKDMMSS